MRALLIHNEYGAPSGEESELQHIADLLRSRGHCVELFTRSSQGLESSILRRAGAFFSGIYNPFACVDVARRAREFRPDIALVQNLFPWISPAVLPVLRKMGIPIAMLVANYRLLCPTGLFVCHGAVCERCAAGPEYWCILNNCEANWPKSVGYALRNAVARKYGWYRDNVSAYMCASSFLKNKLVKAGFAEERIDVIPNLVSDPHEYDCTKVSPVGDYVAYAGRLSPEKGIHTLLRAAAKCPGIRFRIAGRQRQDMELPALLPSNVELTGFLQGDKLRQLYDGARLVAVPSECYETFGMAVAEAMLFGRPVVVSRIGVFPEFVKDRETGLLFSPGDDQDLASKLQELWADPAACERMGKAGRRRALDRYGPDAFYAKIMSLFSKARQLRIGEVRAAAHCAKSP